MGTTTSSLPFEYISGLGHGSFGVVLKAKNTLSGSQSAVKIIFPDDANDIKYLKRECEIMKDKDNTNVVKIQNVFETVFNSVSELEKIVKVVNDDKIHDKLDIYMTKIRRKKAIPAILIEMELCGPTLREWLNQNVNHDKKDLRLQLTQVKIIKDMISGMQYLHENNIIHRDFKPENVMFSLPNEYDPFPFPLKIGDFGLCRILHSEESKTSTLTSRTGTLDYMAPEMDGNSYNFQSDIYSLGLVIWEVVQLIPFKNRKDIFIELVRGKNALVVKSFLPDISSAIISMTKKKLKDRMKSLNKVEDSSIARLKVQLNKLLVEIKAQIGTNTYVARNGDELKNILSHCDAGDTINLTEGEFEGPFDIKCSGVKINGQGNKTVIKSQKEKETLLRILGDNCCVSNLHVNYSGCGIWLRGSNNSIENVGLVGFGDRLTGLWIDGNNSKISGLSVSQDKFTISDGIRLNGSDNILENIEINNMDHGIDIHSSNHTLSNIICNNTCKGVVISGSKNKLSTFKYKINQQFLVKSVKCYGVWVSGSEIELEDIQCSGQVDFGIDFHSFSLDCKVSNSICGPLKIGGRCHTLYNVDCGLFIKLYGEGHALIKCRGKLLETDRDNQQLERFEITENKFDVIKTIKIKKIS